MSRARRRRTIWSTAMPAEPRSAPRPDANESLPPGWRFSRAPRQRRQEWSKGRSTYGLQMPDWQTGQQILRFHTYGLVRGHRQDQVHRFASYLLEHEFGIVKGHPEQSDDAGHSGFINIFSVPEHVSDFGPIGVESDVPGEIDVIQFLQRVDSDMFPDEMRDQAVVRLFGRLRSLMAGSRVAG